MKRSLTCLGIALAAAIAPLKAEAASFNKLYVFGDSLADAGNFYEVTALPTSPTPIPIPQSPPYAQRFSNGPIWVEYFAEDFQLNPALVTQLLADPTTDISDGIYFGFGGASAGTGNVVAPPLTNTGALAQVAGLYSNLFNIPGFQINEDDLFIYLAGANDFAGSRVTPKETDFNIPLRNTSAALRVLVASGAKNILVSNLPDISLTPRFLGDSEAPAISDRITQYNAALPTLLDDLSQVAPDVNFVQFDLNGLLKAAIANPAAFGLTNVSSPCLADYTFPVDTDFAVCDNPDNYLFWDDFHPTSKANEFIAAAALAEFEEPERVPEPSAELGLLALVATAGTTYLWRRRQAHPPSAEPLS